VIAAAGPAGATLQLLQQATDKMALPADDASPIGGRRSEAFRADLAKRVGLELTALQC